MSSKPKQQGAQVDKTKEQALKGVPCMQNLKLKDRVSLGCLRGRKRCHGASMCASAVAVSAIRVFQHSLLQIFATWYYRYIPDLTSTFCLHRNFSISEPASSFATPRWSSSTVHSFLTESYVMSDRRRLNGPAGGTQPIQYLPSKVEPPSRQRTRKPNELRKICMYLSTL